MKQQQNRLTCARPVSSQSPAIYTSFPVAKPTTAVRQPCCCIGRIQNTPRPQVVEFGAKGYGLLAKAGGHQAHSTSGVQLVYSCGQRLGELCGQLVPDSTEYDDGMSMILQRDDIWQVSGDAQGTTGYIRRRGNHGGLRGRLLERGPLLMWP